MSGSITFGEVRDLIVDKMHKFQKSEHGPDGSDPSDLEIIQIRFKLKEIDVAYDNRTLSIDVGQAWIRFSVRNGNSVQRTIGEIGRRWFERDGYIYANIYTPPMLGNGIMDEIATGIKCLFEGKKITYNNDEENINDEEKINNANIRFLGATYNEREVEGGGIHFEGTIQIDFTFDELL